MMTDKSQPAAAHVSYHLRMAAVFAVAGETEESAAETVLAWTLLATALPAHAGAAANVAAELIDRNVAGVSDAHRERFLRSARARAMDIESHYVTTGQRVEAELYAAVADQMDTAIRTLVT